MTLRRSLLAAFVLVAAAACTAPTAPAPTKRTVAPTNILKDGVPSDTSGDNDRSGWPITHG